jgi:cytochrome c553
MKRALISTVLLASLSFLAQAQGAKPGDPKEGEKKAAMCIGCHGIKGYQASFPEVHKVPMISGQGGKYIAAALTAYKKGERKHPTMRGVAVSLTDQDIADLSAFYETHGGQAAAVPEQAPAAKADVAKLFEKGACASCHGANFNKPIDGSYPKIAGQHADYLYVALKAYKTEGNANVGRGNPIMAGMAKQFSNAELRAMADYLAALPGELRTIKEASFR